MKCFSFLTIFFLLGLSLGFSQVGIGTESPEGILDIQSTDSGLVLPRVADTTAVSLPQNGMLIYDLSDKCAKLYSHDKWSECISAKNTRKLVAECDQNSVEGFFWTNQALSSAQFSVTLVNDMFTSSSPSITIQPSDLSLSGTGLGTVSVEPTVSPSTTFTLAPGQSQTLSYPLSGTPQAGDIQFDWSLLGNLSCSVTQPVGTVAFSSFPVTKFIPSSDMQNGGVGDYQGIIAHAPDTLKINIPYENALGNYPAYTSSPISVVGQGGDANDLQLYYPAGSFDPSGSGNIEARVVVSGSDTTFNVKKQFVGVSELIGSLPFEMNGVYQGEVVLNAIGGIIDKYYGDGVHDFVYLPVYNASTQKTWLNNNLGAHYANVNHPDFDPTQQAASKGDYRAYGSLFQKGRDAEGHEIVNWISSTAADWTSDVTTIVATTPIANAGNPWDGKNIKDSGSSFGSWLYPHDYTLWDGINALNNPCPEEYRVPTESEFLEEISSWSSSNANGAFGSMLKLTLAGYRNIFTLVSQNASGVYHASNHSSAGSVYIFFNTSIAFSSLSSSSTQGMVVRCIKDWYWKRL